VTGAELAARASIRLLMFFLCSAGGDGAGVLMGRFGCRPAFVRAAASIWTGPAAGELLRAAGRTLRI
jgi:hypothetical protein